MHGNGTVIGDFEGIYRNAVVCLACEDGQGFCYLVSMYAKSASTGVLHGRGI